MLRASRRVAVRSSGPGRPVSVETFRSVELKHAICVKSFRGMQSFHVVAACGAVSRHRPGLWAEGIAVAAKLTALCDNSLKLTRSFTALPRCATDGEPGTV